MIEQLSRVKQTDGDVAGAVRLEELVEMLPDARNPLDDAVVRRTVLGRAAATHLGVGEPPSKVACEEAVDGLHVVGAEHPAEVVVQLEVGRRTRRHGLVHRSNDVRTGRIHRSWHTLQLQLQQLGLFVLRPLQVDRGRITQFKCFQTRHMMR